VGDFNMPISPMDRSFRQKYINNETSELNATIDQMDLINIYRVFLPAISQYTFFSTAYGTFSNINHILRHKASFRNYNKGEVFKKHK
jgi:hypothetical protein